MRSPFALGLVLAGAIAGGGGAAGYAGGLQSVGNIGDAFVPREKRGKGQRNCRGKGAVAKPRKRPNMRTVSKRVRAKHRKAARGR